MSKSFLFILGFVAATMVCQPALAASGQCAALRELVYALDAADDHYSPGNCAHNAVHVLRELAAQNIDLAKARVLFLFHKNRTPQATWDMIYPQKARDREDGWAYHVVIEYAGRILDPAFRQRNKAPMSSEYFDRMFTPRKIFFWTLGRQITRLEDIRIKAFSAEEYAKQDPEKPIYAQLYVFAPIPQLTISDYLANQAVD